jgi:hypothetical protein
MMSAGSYRGPGAVWEVLYVEVRNLPIPGAASRKLEAKR